VFRFICSPNGGSCIIDYAVVECCVVENISAMFDPAIDPPPCVRRSILIDEIIPGYETDWVCTTLTVEAILQLDGTIGVY
jgi:hypothetical protein